jgi:tetratricopeptide (TPR) repeat protein
MGKKRSELRQILRDARRYEGSGDLYNAVKLYKLLVREAPEWVEPFRQLGKFYKNRGEWKPAFHYTKKALAMDPSLQTAWWDLSIAATALDKPGLARGIWSKFGHPVEKPWPHRPVSIRMQYDRHYEIVWAKSLDPVRASIQNIPAPNSDRRFGDIVLFDREVAGHHIVQRKRYPVFDELGLYKRSLYQTYSCQVWPREKTDVDLLDKLAVQAGLGFEVWSNAERAWTHPRRPEYYDPGQRAQEEGLAVVEVALAALSDREVLRVLRNWEIICLGRFEVPVRHG